MTKLIHQKDIPYKQLIRGIISYIPFNRHIYKRYVGDSSYSSSNPRFCYSFWLRILVTLHNKNLQNQIVNVAEIGNSSSIGVGLMALLTGVKTYSSLEVERYDLIQKSLEMFEELVSLIKNKEDIPDDKEYPRINLRIDSYKFPNEILTDEKMQELLSESRLNQIRYAIQNLHRNDNNDIIRYYVHWEDSLESIKGSFDLIFSRAVLEHIADYPGAYNSLKSCLTPQGVMIHDIEYHHHGIGPYWNSHWSYPTFLWNLIRGKRPYITNRSNHTQHLDTLKEVGFEILSEDRQLRESVLDRKSLANKFRNISDQDFQSYGGWIISRNR